MLDTLFASLTGTADLGRETSASDGGTDEGNGVDRPETPGGDGLRVIADDVAVADSDATSVFAGTVDSVAASFLRGLDDPAYVMDTEGTITHTNEACQDLYGHEAGDSIGANVFEFDDVDNSIIEPVLADGERIDGREATVALDDGSRQ